MRKIDFNNNFLGFEDKEDILVDTGILLALLNEYDTWNDTVKNLFDNYVFSNENVLFLYINPCIQNEITNLISQGKSIEWYGKRHSDFNVTPDEVDRVEKESIEAIRLLIEEEILLILDSNKESALKQLELYRELGAADAVNLSIVNEYGISLLTVDNKLVNNIEKNIGKLENIHNIYYTTPRHKTY